MTTVGRWSPNKVRKRLLDGTWAEPLGGMVLMTPTSATATGTGSSATIGINGSVTFSSCATLSLNGVFNTDYDNYMISMRYKSSANVIQLQARFRTAGTDASGSNYTIQSLNASSTSVTGSRSTSQTSAFMGQADDDNLSGEMIYIYGPFLSQPTAWRNTNVMGNSGGTIYDFAGTHSLSTSYDGLTLIGEAGFLLSGLVAVYGLVGT
jgi:hypothetical protein